MKKTISVTIDGTLDGAPLRGTMTGEVEIVTDPDPLPPPPPPPSTGVRKVGVRLHPRAPGKQWVSFGLPLPVGVLADPVMVRVVIGGVEKPTYRRGLCDWRAIPPAELLPAGHKPTFMGVRSVLLQWAHEFPTTAPVDVVVELGVKGAVLSSGVAVKDTMRVANDGRLYLGTEGAWEPTVLAVIDPKWLVCTGIHPATGLAGSVPALAALDLAQRNFFGTAVKDYRTAWDAPAGSWPVGDGQHVDLGASEDGPWLYQRAQVFYGLHARTGWLDPLREFFHAVTHYQSLLWTDADGPGNKWTAGFFKVKNPVALKPYKDPKYSYSEDLFTYYLLTGDERTLPYFGWISAAQKLGVHNVGWTERFSAYELMAYTVEYEVTGAAAALAAARKHVDGLVERSTRPNSTGAIPGCWLANDEWGTDGFSPWMSPILMTHLLRYYGATGDERVPLMLVRVAKCILKWGIQLGTIEKVKKLVPFYGATTVGTPRDLDGDPLKGGEHAANVAQGLAIGRLFAQGGDRDALGAAEGALIDSAEWFWAYWTRTTEGRPKFRLAPWRKYNWWFRAAGIHSWVDARPTLPG